MDSSPVATVSLTSTWFIQPGCEAAVMAGLATLAQTVYAEEPGTLVYRVHTPLTDPELVSLPPIAPGTVVFYEEYRDASAFLAHLNGPAFTGFTQAYGAMFSAAHGQPFTTVSFLALAAGFTRPAGRVPVPAPPPLKNRHPSRMFEIIARDQESAMAFYGGAFGWRYERGSAGFAYIHFGAGADQSLGGIGQAVAGVPGEEPGCRFYLTVEHLETTLAAVLAAGGSQLMAPTAADGYRFAMFTDPEGNPVGLLEPF